ncbi:MAG: YegP family protein [Croceitalea sp.]|nr:YegP family protein [Croceitalea sp.]
MLKINQTDSGKLQFEVFSSNGGLLMKSIEFDSKSDFDTIVQKLDSIKNSSLSIERKTMLGGQFVFHLKDTNSRMVGQSGTYSSEAGMENGINNLLQNLIKAT